MGYADGESRYEDEGDAVFRADADRLGYSPADPREPGLGRGLYAYYRDNGIVPPKVLEEVLPARELGRDFTGADFNHPASDITGAPI